MCKYPVALRAISRHRACGWAPKSIKNLTKLNQKSSKILPKLGSWGLLGPPVGLWEGSWGILAPRANIITKKLIRWTPLAPPSWSQDPPKIH